MNSRLSWQQFKVLLFVATLFASLLAFPGVASKGLLFVQNLFALPLVANGKDSTNTSTANIKDTNYPIPSGAYFCVSPNGKDTNSGKNPASPWPIAKPLNQLQVGQQLFSGARLTVKLKVLLIRN